MPWKTIEIGATQHDASKIRAKQVSDALKAIGMAQGYPDGVLVDPQTKRRVLGCYGCGELVWLDPEPCVVSSLCERCETTCARCGKPHAWTPESVHENYNGRAICDPCFEWQNIPAECAG